MSNFDLVIHGGTLVFTDEAVPGDIGVRDGKIAAIAAPGMLGNGSRTIDATDLHVFPGAIDPHVHLQTFQSTFDVNVRTETRNAAIGGCTTMIPTLLNREDASVSFLDYYPWALEAVERDSVIDAGFSAVIGTDQQIEELPTMAYDCGITSYKFYMAYTQDEAAVFGILAVDDAQFLAGLRQVAAIGKPAIAMVHAENMSIIHNLKAKYIAAGRDDLKAWTDARPDIAEEEATGRAIWYTKETGSQLYIVHMTIGRGVDWVRQAKAEGVDVIAETCPHYLVLTKYDNDKVGSLAKVNPPLRTERDRLALLAGVNAGVIDAIATDHAPHAPEEKQCEFDQAPFGISCAETALATVTTLVERGELELGAALRALTQGPVEAFSLEGHVPGIGTLAVGAPGDVTVFDPEERWTVDPLRFASKGRNTPLAGVELQGRVRAVVVGGELRHVAEAAHV